MFVTDEMVDAAFKVSTGRIANKDTMRDALKAALENSGTKAPQTVALERIADALEKIAVSGVTHSHTHYDGARSFGGGGNL